MSRTVATAAGVAVAILVALATLASRHASPTVVSPVVPHGRWNDLWVVALVAALAFYAFGVVAGARSLTLIVAMVIALAVQLLPLAAPLLLSKDAYLYWDEARIVTVHRSSPYRSTPNDFRDDPALPYVSEEWRPTVAPYGPTWETLSLAPASAAGSSARHAAFAYKLFAALGVVVTLAVIALRTRDGAAVALLGWNPLVALHYAGGGHSDSWLVALLCLAIAAGARAAGGAAWAFAATFKPLGIILLPLELARSRFSRRPAFWIGGGIAAVALLAASTAEWGTGWIRASLVGVHGSSPLGGVHWLTRAGVRHHDAVAVGLVVFAAVYAWLFVRAWRSGRSHLALAATALCLTSSLLRPWYAIWPLALAGIEEDAVGGLAAIALTAYLLLADAVTL